MSTNYIRGQGYVTDVYYPSVPHFDYFTVRVGDIIYYTTYAPTETDRINETTWYAVGLRYNMFLIESHSEPNVTASIVWSSKKRDLLRQVRAPLHTVRSGVGLNTLQRGDRVDLTWSSDDSKILDVRVETYRDEIPVTQIGFMTTNPTYTS